MVQRRRRDLEHVGVHGACHPGAASWELASCPESDARARHILVTHLATIMRTNSAGGNHISVGHDLQSMADPFMSSP